jgi:membrane fusion protein, multidrug efflux system
MMFLRRASFSPCGVFALVFAIALPLSTGCSKKKVNHSAPPPVPVLTADAVKMDMPVELREIGAVEAFNTVSVTARVGGQLMHVGFREGQDVKKGDLLFRIDPGPFEAALAQARANLDRDRAALTNAEADAARFKDLVQKDYVTKQDYEAADSKAAQARATVDADSALVRSARLNLEYCTILAPISGRTGNLLVKEGNLITANGPTPLVTINQVTPVYINFSIPEQYLSKVRANIAGKQLAVWAFLPSDSTRIFDGNLTFIDNTVDRSTGMILLKATFPNTDRALWPGQYVQTGLVLEKQLDATVIPKEAVQSSQAGDYVYVVASGDTAQLRPVIQGAESAGKVVITKGVAPGDRVVTDGQMMLTSGAKVRIRSALAQDKPGGARKQ